MQKRAKYMSEWLDNSQKSVQKMQLRIEGRKNGSPNTTRNYCVGVKQFLTFLGEAHPDLTVEKMKRGDIGATECIDSWFDYMELKGLTHGTQLAYFHGVKKWLSTNKVKVKWDEIELPSKEVLEEDRAPTTEELRDIVNNYCYSLRDKAIVLCAKSSGLRVGTLLSLQWKDLDFDTFKDVVVVVVKAQKGRKIKGRKTFITFFDSEARKMLLEYKAKLQREGRQCNAETSVFNIIADNFRMQWNRILKRANKNQKSRRWNQLHFHTLRKYFETRCKIAGIPASFYKCWMTHRGGKDADTYLDASYFRPLLEQHHKEYKKAMKELAVLEVAQVKIERIVESRQRQFESRFEDKLNMLEAENAELQEMVAELMKTIKRARKYGAEELESG